MGIIDGSVEMSDTDELLSSDEGDSSPSYRGMDRRGRTPFTARSMWNPLIGSMGLILGLFVSFAMLGVFGFHLEEHETVSIASLLTTATMILAWLFALFCALRRAILGELTAVVSGFGVLLVGGLVPGTRALALPFLGAGGTSRGALETLGIAANVVGYLLLVAALVLPEVWVRVRAWRIIIGAIVLTILLWMVLLFPLGIGARLAVVTLMGSRMQGHSAPALVLAMAWLILAIAHQVRGMRTYRRMHVWLGSALLAWALSYFIIPLWARSEAWVLATGCLEVLAMGLALAGVDLELEWTFSHQRAQLFDSLLSTRVTITEREIEDGARRRQLHDVRNALLSIEGAAATLQRYHDSLRLQDREVLTDMLGSQIFYLQRLLSSTPDRSSMNLSDVVTLACDGLDDMEIRLHDRTREILEGGEVLGAVESCVKSVRLVLDYFCQVSPRRSLCIEAEPVGDTICLRLWGETSNNYGEQEISQKGDHLELYAAKLLMNRQGGDLKVSGNKSYEQVTLTFSVLGVESAMCKDASLVLMRQSQDQVLTPEPSYMHRRSKARESIVLSRLSPNGIAGQSGEN